MTFITKISRTVYEVNGKEVDISKPQYGKNLKAAEYRAMLNYIDCLKKEEAWQIEKENRHLFN